MYSLYETSTLLQHICAITAYRTPIHTHTHKRTAEHFLLELKEIIDLCVHKNIVVVALQGKPKSDIWLVVENAKEKSENSI